MKASSLFVATVEVAIQPTIGLAWQHKTANPLVFKCTAPLQWHIQYIHTYIWQMCMHVCVFCIVTAPRQMPLRSITRRMRCSFPAALSDHNLRKLMSSTVHKHSYQHSYRYSRVQSAYTHTHTRMYSCHI